jgi:hypothetical protein
VQHKNEKTIQKFYQMRIMDFLVRKITLEYEINFNREMQKQDPNAAADGYDSGNDSSNNSENDDAKATADNNRFTTAQARTTVARVRHTTSSHHFLVCWLTIHGTHARTNAGTEEAAYDRLAYAESGQWGPSVSHVPRPGHASPVEAANEEEGQGQGGRQRRGKYQ